MPNGPTVRGPCRRCGDVRTYRTALYADDEDGEGNPWVRANRARLKLKEKS
jgi:hypothetical protein